MTVPKCTDSKIGSLLFAYEIGALGSEDIDRFELHLLECEHCFLAAKRFASFAKMLREDGMMRDEIARTASGDSTLSFWKRMRRYLWPPLPFPFRPALTYLVILVLLYPAIIPA